MWLMEHPNSKGKGTQNEARQHEISECQWYKNNNSNNIYEAYFVPSNVPSIFVPNFISSSYKP